MDTTMTYQATIRETPTIRVAALAHRGEQAVRENERGFALVVAGALQDREFVAAEPRHQVGLARAGGEPLRRLLQQRVADRVAERVVHRLELVEVEYQHVETLAVPAQPRRPTSRLPRASPTAKVAYTATSPPRPRWRSNPGVRRFGTTR